MGTQTHKLIAVLVFSFSTSAFATKLTVQPVQGHTEFTAIGRPAMLHISGESQGPAGELNLENQKITGVLKLALTDLKTGIEMRDHHMKEKYLQVDKYPTAQLEVSSFSLPDLKAGQTASGVPFEGKLTLHGQTEPVKGSADIEATDKGYKVNSHFDLKLSDYKIEIPSYMGIKVADKVDLAISLNVNR